MNEIFENTNLDAIQMVIAIATSVGAGVGLLSYFAIRKKPSLSCAFETSHYTKGGAGSLHFVIRNDGNANAYHIEIDISPHLIILPNKTKITNIKHLPILTANTARQLKHVKYKDNKTKEFVVTIRWRNSNKGIIRYKTKHTMSIADEYRAMHAKPEFMGIVSAIESNTDAHISLGKKVEAQNNDIIRLLALGNKKTK